MGYKLTWMYIRPNGTEQKIRPTWWQPWANTVAYLKLNWNGTDSSGNWNNATIYNPLWATENWRQYLQWTYSTDNSWCYAVLPVTPLSSECTFQAWIKMDTNTLNYTMYMWCYTEWSDPWCFAAATMNSDYYWCPISNWSRLNPILDYGQESIVTWWHLQTVTIKDGKQVFYLDWVSIGSNNRNDANRTATNTVPFMLNTGNNLSRTASCIIWDFILESKSWTAQEVVDYYDLTKASYWIS